MSKEISARARVLVGEWLWDRETARQQAGYYCDIRPWGDNGDAATASAERTYELILEELGGDAELRRALINNMVMGTPMP